MLLFKPHLWIDTDWNAVGIGLAILSGIAAVAVLVYLAYFTEIEDTPIKGIPKDAICYNVDGSWYCYTSSRGMACEVIK